MPLVNKLSVVPLRRPQPAQSSSRQGVARLELVDSGGKTVLKDLFHSQPLRLLFPHETADDVFPAVIACVSGGLVGGDRLETGVSLGEAAKSMVIGQAAEKVYRSLGADSVVENNLTVGAGAWLEWLPQETILFDGARLRRRTVARVDPAGQFLGGEILAFGRAARGEGLTHGLVQDGWEIRKDNGALIWKDVLHMDGDLAALIVHPASFDGARAYGTLLYVGEKARTLLPQVRASLESMTGSMVKSGVTVVRDVLLVRFLSPSVFELRRTYAAIWCLLRHQAAGLPPAMPRLWEV